MHVLTSRLPISALLFFAIVLSLSAQTSKAIVSITSPDDGTTVTANPCPNAPCTIALEFNVVVTGLAMDSAVLEFTPATGIGFESVLCLPPDPIEQLPGCPDNITVFFTDSVLLTPNEWDVQVRIKRGGQTELSVPIQITVLSPNITPAGAVTLSEVNPISGSPPIVLRDPGAAHPSGITSTETEVNIVGTNLDNNPFLQVYLAPVPNGEPELTAESGLPVSDWCRFEADIINSGSAAGGESFLTVKIPDLPEQASTTCGINPGPVGSIFSKNWRWLIRDPWIRAEREHEWWAIPSPRQVPWQNEPPFKIVKNAYPDIDGFGFANHATDPRYNEFLTVYGNNAYLCVGALGLCLTRIPDPLYHLLWWPIYREVIADTGGSCNGLSATSLLFAREELQTEDFESDVHFPFGFDTPGPNSVTAFDDKGNAYQEGVATYQDSNFCTPVCSPPKPANLWANVRMNHGVQISREFLFEMIETLGEAILDPDDLSAFKGVPNTTLARVNANPQGYVMCFFQFGNGHCVTPYQVLGNKMFVYDNNAPGDESRYIEVVNGDYNYPARSKEPNSGNAIMAFPIDIWKNDRHLLGFGELATLIGGDFVQFLYMIAVGSGDMTVTNAAGGRWGKEDDGSFSDAMLGAVSIPPLGPQDVDAQAMPLLLAMNQPAPNVQINAEGGQYIFHSGAGGHLLQLESNANTGDKDQIQLGYVQQQLKAFDFTPENDAARFIPRIGLAIDEEESALFHWLGLHVPKGKSVGFDADKNTQSATYRNDTGNPSHYLLALDFGSGAAESSGRMLYGPFNLPDGASQRIVLADWPAVDEVVSEIDLDGDGNPDQTDTVTGRPLTSPLVQSNSTDLAITKSALPASEAPITAVNYSLTVLNNGPNVATDVVLIDAPTTNVVISALSVSSGSCSNTSVVNCSLGDIAVGAEVTLSYLATLSNSENPANLAVVFANEGDPDLTNNSVIVTGSGDDIFDDDFE